MAATLPRPVLVIPGALCDEYGDLTLLKDQFAPTQSRYNKCRDQLAKLVADADPESEFRVEGERYRVMISARTFERHADKEKVRKVLGAQKFMEAATVTLKALEGYLLKPDIDKLVVTAQTGPRTFLPIPLIK